MNQVMKYKIPGPPKETLQSNPDKSNSKVVKKLWELEKIDVSQDKGVFTVLKGTERKYKGYIYPEVVRATQQAKGVIPLIAKIIPKTLLISPYNRDKIKDAFTLYADKILKRYYLKPDRFCKSGRELYKAGMNITESEMDKKLVMIFCMIWEYDNAYRFRGQDMLGNIRGASMKEVYRALDFGIERGNSKKIKKYLKKIKNLMRFINKKKIIKFIKKLDIENIKLDDDDRYFCYNKNYDYDGLNRNQRLNWLKDNDNNINNNK